MSDERIEMPVRIWSSFGHCQSCGKSEDDNVSVMSLAVSDHRPVVQRRRARNPLVVLCWECLKPVVAELYENPPEE